MNIRPKFVAISQRVVEVTGRNETRDCLDEAWAGWLQTLGLVPVPVPNQLDSVVAFLAGIQPVGIVLSGGNNLTLPVYADPASPGDAFESRDTAEREMVDFARREGLPILGCCRGMQFLNAYFGGRLSSLRGSPVNHVAAEHTVSIDNGSFARIAGSRQLKVNSFHDFGIGADEIAPPLLASAITPGDGSIEACVHHSEPIVGIMWHPERGNPAAAFDRALAMQLFHGRDFHRRAQSAKDTAVHTS